MLVTTEQLAQPTFASLLIIGASGTGKTSSIASIHKVLRLRHLPTKLAIFDFDDDGAEPLLRMARQGRETFSDKPNTVPPWIEDILLFRYPIKRTRFTASESNPAPYRDINLALDFMTEFNTLNERIDTRTRQWLPDKGIGAIVLDPLTGVSDIYEDYVWSIRKREIGAPPETRENRGSITGVSWTEWNLLGENIRNVYMTAKGFPCYVVCTGHIDQREEEVKGPQSRHGTDNDPIVTGKWFTVPLLTKSLAMKISKDFSTTLLATENFKFETRNNEHLRGIRSRGKDNLPQFVEQDLSLVLDI
jgi:hypothetical protein